MAEIRYDIFTNIEQVAETYERSTGRIIEQAKRLTQAQEAAFRAAMPGGPGGSGAAVAQENALAEATRRKTAAQGEAATSARALEREQTRLIQKGITALSTLGEESRAYAQLTQFQLRAAEVQGLLVNRGEILSQIQTRLAASGDRAAQMFSAQAVRARDLRLNMLGLNTSMAELASIATIAGGRLGLLLTQLTLIGDVIGRRFSALGGGSGGGVGFPLLIGIGAGIAGIVAAGAALRSLVQEGSEAEQQLLKLGAIVRATGGSAGFTAKEIDSLAEEIAFATLATEEQVKDAAAQLLTFRSISGETFQRTLALAQDLAAAGFGSVGSAALQLGKALEAPILGMTQLRRSGVVLSDSQKEVIRSLEESGRHLEAQKALLDAVAERVAGTGRGEAGGLAGAWQELGERLDEFVEESSKRIGIITALANAVDILVSVIPSGRGQTPQQERIAINEELSQLAREPTTRSGLNDELINKLLERRALLNDQIAASERRIADARAKGEAQSAADEAERRAEALRDLTLRLDGAAKAEDEFRQIKQQLDEQLAAGNIDLRKYGELIGLAREQTIEGTPAARAYAAEVERQAEAQKKAREALDDSIAARREEIRWLDEYAAAIKAGEGPQKEAEIRRRNELEVRREILAAQRQGLEIGDAERAQIEADVQALTEKEQVIQRLKDAQELSRREQERQSKEAAEALAEPFENAMEAIQESISGTISDVLKNGVSSFKDFSGKILDIFIDMAAQLATLLIFRPQVVLGALAGGVNPLDILTGGGTPIVTPAQAKAQQATDQQTGLLTRIVGGFAKLDFSLGGISDKLREVFDLPNRFDVQMREASREALGVEAGFRDRITELVGANAQGLLGAAIIGLGGVIGGIASAGGSLKNTIAGVASGLLTAAGAVFGSLFFGIGAPIGGAIGGALGGILGGPIGSGLAKGLDLLRGTPQVQSNNIGPLLADLLLVGLPLSGLFFPPPTGRGQLITRPPGTAAANPFIPFDPALGGQVQARVAGAPGIIGPGGNILPEGLSGARSGEFFRGVFEETVFGEVGLAGPTGTKFKKAFIQQIVNFFEDLDIAIALQLKEVEFRNVEQALQTTETELRKRQPDRFFRELTLERFQTVLAGLETPAEAIADITQRLNATVAGVKPKEKLQVMFDFITDFLEGRATLIESLDQLKVFAGVKFETTAFESIIETIHRAVLVLRERGEDFGIDLGDLDALAAAARAEAKIKVEETFRLQTLELVDPLAAALFSLNEEREAAIREAEAADISIEEVERLFGIRRLRIVEEANQAILDVLEARLVAPEISATTRLGEAVGKIEEISEQILAGGGGPTARQDAAVAFQRALTAAEELFGFTAPFFGLESLLTEQLQRIIDFVPSAPDLTAAIDTSSLVEQSRLSNETLQLIGVSLDVAAAREQEQNENILEELRALRAENALLRADLNRALDRIGAMAA